MVNEPIVIWPPCSFYADCSAYGSYVDCTWDYADYYGMGAMVCCPAW